MMKHFFYSLAFSLSIMISIPSKGTSVDLFEKKVDSKTLAYSESQGFFEGLEENEHLSLLRALKNVDPETLQIVNDALFLSSFDIKLIRALKKVDMSKVIPLMERASNKDVFLKELLQAKRNRFQSTEVFRSICGTVLEPHPSSKVRVSKRLSKGLKGSALSVVEAAKDRGLFDTPSR